MDFDFQTALLSAQSLVREELEQAEAVMQAVAQDAPPGTSERLRHLMGRKGKRIRSTLLALVAASGQAGDISRISHACASVELLHLASLVHDDIIDGTEIRRGARTAHKEWGSQVAVLVGDYLLSESMRCLLGDSDKRVLEVLSKAANRLIVGEIQELDNTGNTELTSDDYLSIIWGKTAALLDASAKLGALIAGFDDALLDKCGKMGAYFGIAFQIIDDLLDFGYGAKNLDKAKFTDLANGLMTLPLILYLEGAAKEAKLEMLALVARASEDGVPEAICERLQTSGVFERVKKIAVSYLDTATDLANELPSGQISEQLGLLFSQMSNRTN